MAQNSQKIERITKGALESMRKIFGFLNKWFFMISIMVALFFCVFVWYKFIWKADWTDDKKQKYISEQAKFSFDKVGYQRMSDMISTRKEKFENFPSYTGKDIFFPEGF